MGKGRGGKDKYPGRLAEKHAQRKKKKRILKEVGVQQGNGGCPGGKGSKGG